MADAITVSCPSCRTTFPVDPDKVPVGGVNARCSDCQDIFRVEAPLEGVSAEPAEPGDVGPSATEAELPGAGTAPPSEEKTVAVEDAMEDETPAVEEEPEEADPLGLEEAESDVGEEAAGFDDYFTRADEGADTGTVATEGASEEAPTGEIPALEDAAPSTEEASEPLPELEEVAGQGEGEEEQEQEEEQEFAEPLPGLDDAGMEGPELEEPGFETPVIETEEPEEAAAVGPDEPAVAEADEPAVAEAEPTVEKPRPTFGNRSPEEKAQRLARVLVSDMITYNPTMYETALARGTLKEDFADEIEKSWDEYVEQVGEELANSTSHWTDALNDILAKGEKTF